MMQAHSSVLPGACSWSARLPPSPRPARFTWPSRVRTPTAAAPLRPYRTIKYAVSQSVSGDRILVHAGTYNESWIYVAAGTELVSADGLWAAKIYSGNSSAVRLEYSNAGIDGFEIYANWNQGSAGDGLVRPLFSSNVWVKNCLVHDAPYDCDVIKVETQQRPDRELRRLQSRPPHGQHQLPGVHRHLWHAGP